MKKRIGTATVFSAACLALMPMAPAYAANWVYVATNINGAAYYYDSNTIRRSGNQVTVWEKADYSRDKTVKMREEKSRWRYDCAERTRTLLQLTNYYPNGKLETFTWNTYEQEQTAVTPDTLGEKILEAVCR
jgi:hypothetical protein